MIEILKKIDVALFFFINNAHNVFFDNIMWWISDKYVWLPLYFLFLFLIVKQTKWQFYKPLLYVVLLIAITDQSAGFIKDFVGRYRPTHNLEYSEMVHIVKYYKGGLYSFVSNHAANSFAIAVSMSLIFKELYLKSFALPLLLWAGLVAYSRVYLGVHYPFDILAGALLGSFWAYFLFYFYKKYFRFIR